VLILHDIVVFPKMISPILVTPGPNLLAIQDAQYNFQTLIALVVRDSDIETQSMDAFLPVAVELAVGRLLNLPDGNSSALVQGRRRLELAEFTQIEPYFRARAKILDACHA
jgi:ATP-dependent Lon protease